jgi:hypothetical protein
MHGDKTYHSEILMSTAGFLAVESASRNGISKTEVSALVRGPVIYFG